MGNATGKRKWEKVVFEPRTSSRGASWWRPRETEGCLGRRYWIGPDNDSLICPGPVWSRSRLPARGVGEVVLLHQFAAGKVVVDAWDENAVQQTGLTANPVPKQVMDVKTKRQRGTKGQGTSRNERVATAKAAR